MKYLFFISTLFLLGCAPNPEFKETYKSLCVQNMRNICIFSGYVLLDVVEDRTICICSESISKTVQDISTNAIKVK